MYSFNSSQRAAFLSPQLVSPRDSKTQLKQTTFIKHSIRRLSPSNKFKHPITMSHTTHRDLSRPRLQLAAWIRDTLDPLIAREGPDIMHPDDVLTLHELFVALQHSPDISATTLRATRIHRAVMEVAGKATRRPGRLADECDKVLWIARSTPALYCRGGRLETVAGVGDVTRAVSFKKRAEGVSNDHYRNLVKCANAWRLLFI